MLMTKKLINGLLIASLLLLILTGCGKDKEPNQIVLTINDEKEVYLHEANLHLRQMERYFEEEYGEDVWDVEVEEGKTVIDLVKEQVINQLTNSNLIAYIAKESGISLTEEEQKELDEATQAYYDRILAEEGELEGVKLESIKNMFYNQKYLEKYFEQVMQDFQHNEEELQAYLDNDQNYQMIQEYGYEGVTKQVRARHILISTVDENRQPLSEEEIEEAKAIAEEVLERVKAGEDFVALVEEFSQDPGSVDKGGEYVFGRGRMMPEFEESAFSMEPGEISDLVKTDFGYHIIKLEEIISGDETMIQAVKDSEQQAIEYYIELLKREAFSEKFEVLKENYTVVINNDVWDLVEVIQSRNNTIEE